MGDLNVVKLSGRVRQRNTAGCPAQVILIIYFSPQLDLQVSGRRLLAGSGGAPVTGGSAAASVDNGRRLLAGSGGAPITGGAAEASVDNGRRLLASSGGAPITGGAAAATVDSGRRLLAGSGGAPVTGGAAAATVAKAPSSGQRRLMAGSGGAPATGGAAETTVSSGRKLQDAVVGIPTTTSGATTTSVPPTLRKS